MPYLVPLFFLAMLISPMSHVDFQRWLCRRVEFRGQGPLTRLVFAPSPLKAMTHQPTQLLSQVWLGSVGVCVIGLQFNVLLHSSLVPDCLVGSRLPYDSTVELGWVMCHGLEGGLV